MIQRRIHTRQDDIKQWSIYLSQYFNVALTVAEVKSLLGFRLPVLESKSLEAIQHDRKPSVFTINSMDAPASPADFINNYVEIPSDRYVGFFYEIEGIVHIDSFLNTTKRKERSIIEDLKPKTRKLSKLLEQINYDNILWKTRNGLLLCGMSGVLSEPHARSISHYHHIPFWNYSFSGTKLYVIYDVTEATRRHLVTPKNSDSLSSSPLKLADFKQLAISNYAWVAEIHGHRPGNTIYMPHHFAHDVFTTNVDVLYMGLQGNWLTSLPESSTLLIRASDQENGHMRFQITQQSIDALFLGEVSPSEPRITSGS